MAEGEYITIGKILTTQGNRGALRVLPLTDYPERFQKMRQVRVAVRGSVRVLTLTEVSPHKKFLIVRFKEITDMNLAEELVGGLLEVTRDELVPLPADSFYIFDIVGLDVYDNLEKHLGKVSDVIQTGANDVFVVETGGRPLLLPALKKVVREIDLTGRRMLVEVPEGLVEDDL